MKEPFKILPTKRFEENFKEVVKPEYPPHSKHGTLESEGKAYNQAQQRKVLVPLSEFVKLLVNKNPTYNDNDGVVRKINTSPKDWLLFQNYTNYITQPITEKSLEGVECMIWRNGEKIGLKQLFYLGDYKTIEHAINDGVVFILKS